jgi:HK97 family phage major capsid protein
MSDLHALLDERVVLARHKAGKAAAEARSKYQDPAAQTRAETALSDLKHYVELRELVGVDAGPYTARSGRSFWADAIRSSVHDDPEARDRLGRDAESRSTMSAYGGLVVPARLVDQLAASGHTGRPLCDLLAEPLPTAGGSVDIPEVTTAATAEMQSAENTAGTPDTPATENRSFPIRTVWSEATVSHAAVARAEGTGFDTFVTREVLGAVNALQEAQVLNGTGSNGQPVGILAETTAGTYTLSGTSASDLLDAIARVTATIDGSRGPADTIVMHPRRWRYLLAGAGDRSAAIETSTTLGPVVGRVLGVDVVASGSMPTTLGASTNEDRVIVLRRSDVYVGEELPMVTVHRDHSGSATLTAKVRIARYFASGVVSTEGVQVITGAGTANPYA